MTRTDATIDAETDTDTEVPTDAANSDWYGEETATFGDRLAGAREAAGLTQSEVAHRLGVKTATLRKWEDDLAEPRANRLTMLAGMTGVSLTWLMTGRGEGPEAPGEEPDMSDDVKTMLDEMRVLRSQMAVATSQLAALEKRLRKTLSQPQ
ncbi:helix-turn-helix domain-containing protein [Flavimaricola marinus]|uniref:Transcriptional repressor DicA n=1 Tax=Flavimaricola marinus TaxID=1819565 RepID=A0A238LIE3_9RHOB|nr:helix-turn-helix transcriptional regulator [Flavimaricola marinus]SMY09459.1 transcriptional repressor DicA [Flavimaricola marinus]